MNEVLERLGDSIKHYIIWLKSGECITGDVNDDVAKGILLDGKRFSRLIISDTDGTVTVKRNRIEAIGISDIIETRQCGF